MNVPLFLFGLKKQGATSTLCAIFTAAVCALGAWLLTDVLPVDISVASPLVGSDLLLCALFGGVIFGIGSGTASRFGGAVDEIEMLAVIFAKRMGITVGTLVMAYNFVLYVICGVVIDGWTLPLYFVVTYGAALKYGEFYHRGARPL